MNTRHARPGSPVRQERWISSMPESRGLLANLVAARCRLLDDPDDRALAWWIQGRSWAPGGLEAIAAEMVRRAPIEMARRFGQPSRAELREMSGRFDPYSEPDERRPPSLDALVRELEEAALAPGRNPLLMIQPLANEIRKEEMATVAAGLAPTETAKAVAAALDRCASTGGAVLVEGPARWGKTAAARAWCASSGGLARYVATPPGNDLDALFRAIASALGSASGLTFKAKQVEERIFRTVEGSGLTLVFDDSFRLWPSGDTRQSTPRRLNWLTALIDTGIPVALIATPQWWDFRRAYIAQTGWAVDQLDGRISGVVALPESLSLADCRAVAKAMLPGGPAQAWEILGTLAQASARRLGALEGAVREANSLARGAGRPVPGIEDVKAAVAAAAATDTRFAEGDRAPVGRPRGQAPAAPRPPSVREGAAPMGLGTRGRTEDLSLVAVDRRNEPVTAPNVTG